MIGIASPVFVLIIGGSWAAEQSGLVGSKDGTEGTEGGIQIPDLHVPKVGVL